MFKINSKLFTIILIIAGSILAGCSKDENESPPTNEHAKEQPVAIQKSTYTNFQKLGMAANCKGIDYIKDEYVVDLLNSQVKYVVQVISFQPESIVELSISDGSTTSASIVDFQDGTLSIENDKTYRFSNLNSAMVSVSSSTLFNVTALVVAAYSQNQTSSVTFVDNGSLDTFPESPAALKCFWCSNTVTNEFFPGLCIDIKTTTMFWIFEHQSVSEPYAC